ncbi:hypothetical protein XPA_004956 [Xanthoria parietina]
MKQLYSLFLFFTLLQFLHPVLTANVPGSLNSVLIPPNALKLGADPPPGEQIAVYGTQVKVALLNYLPVRRVDPARYLRVAHNALYDIIKQLSVAPAGDHRVHAPNLGPWRLGALYITAHNPHLKMTWEILAHALRGVLDFYDNWGMMLLTAAILEQDLGYVGELRVGNGYQDVGNGTAVGSVNGTETA